MNDVPRFLDRSALAAADVSAAGLHTMQRAGDLVSLRRGRYLYGADWASATAHERHRFRALELGLEMGGRAVVSHESAAILHGLELPDGPLPKVHITWPASPGRRATTNVHPHRGRLEKADLVRVDDVLTTSVARTVFDLARASLLEPAISAVDSALRLSLVSAAQLGDVIDRYPNVPGALRARRILEFGDARAESVGESICRLRMAQFGLPVPELQTEIVLAGTAIAARVDFDFQTHGTVCEFDGKIKYGRLLKPGQTPGDVVFLEKVREDRIRDTGRQVVRLTWADLGQGAVVVERFGAAFRRAGFTDWRPGGVRFLAPARARTTGRRAV